MKTSNLILILLGGGVLLWFFTRKQTNAAAPSVTVTVPAAPAAPVAPATPAAPIDLAPVTTELQAILAQITSIGQPKVAATK